jgi:FxsC-like protein
VPNLFLSSASGDDDLYVETFFLDLCRTIDTLAGDRVTDRSFLAITSMSTDDWPEDMARALGRCDVFVALCSERYVLNPLCGRQWQVFDQRLRLCEEQTGTRPAAQIAVAWSLDAPIPAGASVIPHGGTGPGLRQLARLRTLRATYERTLADLAERMLTLSKGPSIPAYEPLPPLSETLNAFEVDAADEGAAGSAPRIRFVVAAGTRNEMEQVREDVSFYGVDREQWAPYRPSSPIPIAQRAQTVAAARLFASKVGSIDNIVDAERARGESELVVLLVDSWATRVGACNRALTELDQRRLGRAAVLVPTNATDAETVDNRDDLRFALRRTFRNSIDDPDALLRAEIESAELFDIDLAALIEEARNRSFREGPIRILPASGPAGERPILRGP